MTYPIRLSVFIIICCLSSIWGVSQDTLQHSLLWKVSGNGLKQPSYLYGTLHSICKKDIKLKPKLLNVLNQAYTLVFECNFTELDPYKDRYNSFFIWKFPRDISEEDYMHDNTTLESILTPEKYNFINRFFKDSLRSERGIKGFRFFHPLVPIGIVENSMLGCATGSYERIIGHKMADVIYQYKGLESVRESAALSHRYKTYEILANELYETVKNYKVLKAESKESYKTLIEKYEAENIDYFKIDGDSEEDRVFVFERNIKWMPKIEQMIKKHITVIAVGAGHLAGEKGLIGLLQAKGYTLTPVFE
ncbi:TraB/GumN family protein [Emticicia fontis]